MIDDEGINNKHKHAEMMMLAPSSCCCGAVAMLLAVLWLLREYYEDEPCRGSVLAALNV